MRAPMLLAALAASMWSEWAAAQTPRDPAACCVGVGILWSEDVADVFRSHGAPLTRGYVVMHIYPGSPGRELQALDVITHIGTAALSSRDKAAQTWAGIEAGKPVTLRIARAANRQWTRRTVRLTPTTWGEYVRSMVSVSVDPITQSTVARHKYASASHSDPTGVDVSLRGTGLAPVVRFRVTREDWVHLQRVTVSAGGKAIEIPVTGVSVDVDRGAVHEWVDLPAVGPVADALEMMRDGPVTIRFTGSTFFFDHQLSIADSARLQVVMLAKDLGLQ